MRLLLLTGGSRGIGLAIAEKLAARGYTVIEFSRSAPHSYSVATDFASPLEAHRVVERSLASIEPGQLEELLIVSNAATLAPIGPTSGKPPAQIVENLNTNLVSPVLFVSAVIARFQSASCRKVVANISAGAAHQGVFGWSLYCSTKVGMENFVQSLAIEQQSQPHPFIPVNIDPGIVDTYMHVVAGTASPHDFPAATRFAARRAQGQLTQPERAAAAIAQLLTSSTLSPGSSYHAQDAGV
jgi:benzil reductase ((S)-benzoin forming)